MKNTKNFAVFGLGRYGMAVAKELVQNSKEVIAVDANQKTVNDAAAFLPICKCADVTDAEVIERHITYDCSALGSDHKCSLDFSMMQDLSKFLEDIETIKG